MNATDLRRSRLYACLATCSLACAAPPSADATETSDAELGSDTAGADSEASTTGADVTTQDADGSGDADAESGDDAPPEGCSVPDSDMDARAREALASWELGMPTDLSAGFRDFGLTPISPRNWITVAAEDCSATGIPAGSSCAGFGASVLGICMTTYREDDGAIFDTTVVVYDQVFDGSRSIEEERSVLVHEIGHCLGLKHSEDTNAIMHPVSDPSRVLPNSAELQAVASAYLPQPTEVDAQTASQFFSTTGSGAAIRHFVPPVFHVSSCIGNEPEWLVHAAEPGRTRFVGEDGHSYVRVVQHIREDHGCE